MCGRFTLRTPANVLVGHFMLSGIPGLLPRYNIAPTQPVGVVRQIGQSGDREWVLMRWGLIPSWAKDASIGSRTINARSETVASKPAFRGAFRRRRCLVAADGYFEWQRQGSGKQPYFFHRADDGPFALAGLWESWTDPASGDTSPTIESCTIITAAADRFVAAYHDRMPVVLAPDDYARWLDPELTDASTLESLLAEATVPPWNIDLVGTHVNSPRHDDPACIEIQRTLF